MRRMITGAALLFLFIAASCQPITEARIPEEDGTWGTLFRAWWMKMDTNYIFWYLDSPGQEWDSIYREYAPRFDAISAPIGTDRTEDEKALRMLFDITAGLSDGHYALTVKPDGWGAPAMILPAEIRIFREYGISDGDIFGFALDRKPTDEMKDTDYLAETAEDIIRNSLGIGMNESFMGMMTEKDMPSDLLSEYTLIGLPKIEEPGRMAAFRFIGAVGRTPDDIIYILPSSFPFTAYNNRTGSGYASLASLFRERLKEEIRKGGNGIIIDLRGNRGGYGSDIPYLFGCLLEDDIVIGRQRRKNGPNRLSYGPWQDFTITASQGGGTGMPIAVLVNSGTASCGEIAAMMFRAMKDEGYPVTLIGSETMGANGAIAGNENELAAGQFSVPPCIISAYTPAIINEYRDGTSFEGKGVPPDIHVAFNAAAFRLGSDQRLEKALGIIREKNT